MTPSAPTPRCRSQRATTSPELSGRTSSRSSSMTKSLPVPWYFQIRSSATQVLQQVVQDVGGAALAGGEPADPRVSPEPRHLAPGQRLRPLHDQRRGLVEGASPRQVTRHLSVPDGLARGRGTLEPAVAERADLLDEPVSQLIADPPLDPAREDVARHHDPGGADVSHRVPLPVLGEVGE